MFNPQLNRHGELQHLLSTEGLPRSMVTHILDRARGFVPALDRAGEPLPLLAGKRVCLSFEATSIPARADFEHAARCLSADVFDLDAEVGTQANGKDNSLLDRIRTLTARGADLLVLENRSSGAAHFAARHVAPQVHIVNAGDGAHADPVRALTDVLTILHHKPDLTALSIAIVGDIAHSRVARSLIHAFSTLGVPEVRVIAPLTLLPLGVEQMGVRVFTEMRTGLAGVDVIIMLPSRETLPHYELTHDGLAHAHDNALVLQADRGRADTTIESHSPDCAPAGAVAQCNAFALAVRMAVMSIVAAVQA